jgi:hypothetical protein
MAVLTMAVFIKYFVRDANNIQNYYNKFVPAFLKTQYTKEMWTLLEEDKLTNNITLTDKFGDDSNTKRLRPPTAY